MNNPGWTIAKYFFDSSKLKCTPAMFKRNVGQANQLIAAGYTFDEIKDCIDYLLKYPPRNGFTSIGYLSYAINDVLIRTKAYKISELITYPPAEETETVPMETISNTEKFKLTNKPKVKGSL